MKRNNGLFAHRNSELESNNNFNEGDFSLELKEIMTEEECGRVLEINQENLDRNGGQLHYEGILSHTYALLAKHKDDVVGYMLLEEDFIMRGDIYAMQVAIDNRYKHLGIGSKMCEYAYAHAKGYRFFTASVNENNTVSQKYHEKNGFQIAGENNLGLLYVRPIRKDAELSFDGAQPVKFNIDGFGLESKSTEPGEQ